MAKKITGRNRNKSIPADIFFYSYKPYHCSLNQYKLSKNTIKNKKEQNPCFCYPKDCKQ